ncbi:MAG TPA: TonB-dependent receptor [Thermoanaerobaculia bacterium]|nr:TonB-dependent receptor [Thermoanaerobaculia bacterium]
MKSTFWGRILTVTALLLLVGGAAFAQLQSGNLYAKVSDEQGGALPGVTVTLTGQGAPQVQVTNAQGEVRFLGLSPGSYSIEAQLEGFSTLNYPNVSVNVGRNTSLELTLSAAVEDVITVTAESPLLDTKRISTGNTVSSTELEKIPTARDPWAVLQSTPGVLTDRINVGGNESGQQSQYIGLGSGGDQAVWSLDGVVVTDMSATGSSPGYYDFDAFEEMQVTTGGGDASIATGGVTLNMVTKRGTNEWRGSGRYYQSDKSRQSKFGFDKSDLGKAGPWNGNRAQTTFTQGNQINKVEDYGGELGGPIVKDRLWVWGSYAKPKIDLRTISGFKDFTTLEDWNAKVNAQIAASNSATLFAWQSNKVKIGRNAGPLRPQETTWDQGKFGDSPTAYKVEDTNIFSSNFYLTGLYSKVNGGFELVPEGGNKVPYLDPNGVWHNSFFLIQNERPQEQLKLDASSFFNTGSVSHELKYGASYRTADQTTLSRTQGGGYEIDCGGVCGPNGETSLYGLSRDEFIGVKAKYTSIFAQDTLSIGNLTANIGLRYDKQNGSNSAESVAANALVPDLLPAINYPGQSAGFSWSRIVPRLGLTYALGADRKTLLRASYSQYADQLATGNLAWLNPLGLQSYAYLYGPTRGNGTLPSRSALSLSYFSPNVNPTNGQLLQSNQVDGDLNAPITHELLFSVEHALLPEFVVGLNLTLRKATDLLEQERLVFDCPGGVSTSCATDPAFLNSTGRKHVRSDYVLEPITPRTGVNGRVLPNGQPYNLVVWQLRPGVSTRNGFLLENGDREQDYKGASVTFNKRLSNHWMMRGNLTYSDWTWDSPASENEDPTLGLAGASGQAIRDGDQVVQGSGTGSGSKGNVYINGKWSYSLNGLYQVAPERPWGFNLAANLTGRQGYPAYYYERVGSSGPQRGRNIPDGSLGLAVPVVNRPDQIRYDDVRILDLRVEKEFSFKDFGFTVGADVFNATNEATVLQRNLRLQRSNADNVLEIVSPRIVRLGVKFNFR